MISSFKQIKKRSNSAILILDKAITLDQYCTINLSTSNTELQKIDIKNPNVCQRYIDLILNRNQAKVAFGGYLEKRNIYDNKANFFQNETKRNIHLGIDFWAKAGTKVIAPLDAQVHSFKNNTTIGDYGPTIVLQHEFGGDTFYTLYGHLSVASLKNISKGQLFKAGETIATLGTTAINVNYAPHLHFQIILDMEEKEGDYPGVCSAVDLDFYSKNCPNPNLLLNYI